MWLKPVFDVQTLVFNAGFLVIFVVVKFNCDSVDPCGTLAVVR
jgi:hypothetical protein